MNIKLFLSGLATWCVISVNAQTLHFISMFDTNDNSIGAGMRSERMLINNEMQTIAGYLEEFGYDSQFSDYYGANCGRASLMQAVNALQVSSDDVVIFYYGGHGARAYNNSEDRFPQMCLGESSQSNWVPSSLIKNIISQKNPRLTIILTGCCNKEGAGVTIKSIVAQSSGYTSEANINKTAYKKLFLEAKGIVQLTSSKAGEYSWCGEKGSLFALALLNVLENVGEGRVNADWNSVCQSVKGLVSSLNIPTRDGTAKQHPDYEVSTSTGGPTPRKDNTTIRRRVNDTDYDLSQDIESLLDKSQSANVRLAMIPTVLGKHFASGAKVLTLGRDMSTVVDFEDAEVFLRRITMSPYIKQVNVVEQNGGKNMLVRVHEIRTR